MMMMIVIAIEIMTTGCHVLCLLVLVRSLCLIPAVYPSPLVFLVEGFLERVFYFLHRAYIFPFDLCGKAEQQNDLLLWGLYSHSGLDKVKLTCKCLGGSVLE